MAETVSNKKAPVGLISFIIPVFNEAIGLAKFDSQIKQVIKGYRYELIYVDDGSTDNSAEILATIAKRDPAVKIVRLSRNFGKEATTTAGLHAAKGYAAMIVDADGQHPVELIPDFIKLWQNGAKVVIGVRTSNHKEGWIKKYGSKLFYQSLKAFGVPNVVPGSTDFRLVDRQVVDSFKKLTEHNRVTRALLDWLGYDREFIYFKARPREHGNATYSIRKLVQLALNGFVSLSFTPLYLSGYIGIVITVLSFITTIFAVVEKYIFNDPLGLAITGTAILAVLILFLVGVLLIGQGLMAVYVARIYSETQNRPLYIVKED